MDAGSLVGAFLTIAVTVFIAELTDKDALLLLNLATKMKPLTVFLAGSLAFTLTSAIIVTLGSILVVYVPIFWIKLAGGAIMLGYAVLEYVRGLRIEIGLEKEEERLERQIGGGMYAMLGIVGTLMILDLAGDATELLTIVFVARYSEVLLVFAAVVVALVTASAVETLLGTQLRRFLSSANVRRLSILIFLVIGSVVIASTVFPVL